MSHAAIIPNRASGYRWRDNAICNGDFVAGSILGYAWGGVLSTAADTAKWAMAFASGRLLGAASIEQAWTPTRLKDGSMSKYGLGWMIEPVNGHRSMWHGGGHTTGFTSYLAVYPDDKLVVVVLANSSNANLAPLVRRIAGSYVPALMPRPEPAIEDHDPLVTALLRDCIALAAEGKLEERQFTADLWSLILKQKDPLQQRLKPLGVIQSLALLSRSATEGKRSFRYRAEFVREKLIFTITLDSRGKISELRLAEE